MCTILLFNGLEVLVREEDDRFTVEFLSQMIYHHSEAVEMAEKILKTTTDPEIIKEAELIVSTQTKEIEKMNRWLHQLYQCGPTDLAKRIIQSDECESMSIHPMEPNDKQFVDLMIHHHKEAKVMSLLAIQKSNRSRVRKLAEKMHQDQTDQIKRFIKVDRSLQK